MLNHPHLHINQPQREGDGRQALVVPPLYPAPAASLKPQVLSPKNLSYTQKSALFPSNALSVVSAELLDVIVVR